MSDSPRAVRARLAAKLRHHPEQDHSDTRRDLAAANLEQYVRKVLSAAPPLTDEQRTRLAELLRPVRQPADRQSAVQARLAELDAGGAA